MKRIIAAIAAVVVLAACGAMFTPPGKVPVSEKLSPAAQTAQTAINEANILLIAAANVLGQQLTDGIVSKPEAQLQLNQIREFAARVDRAQQMLDTGDVLGAQNQAELAQRLLIVLHREIAQRARKPQ